jgi:drug/metabolite transporter (DMT)-like permease
MTANKQSLGHFTAAFTVFVWGMTLISTKVLLVSFTPVEIMFYRLVFGLIALCFVSPPRLPRHRSAAGWLHHEWKTMVAGL